MNPKVLLPMIRGVMPGLIAEQIVGVQPMSSPLSSDLRGTVLFEKIHYRHFIKLYNRKKLHTMAHIHSMGYPYMRFNNIGEYFRAESWLHQTLKPGSFVDRYPYVFFAYERDHRLCLLRWS